MYLIGSNKHVSILESIEAFYVVRNAYKVHFEDFQNITRAHKSRNALAFIGFPIHRVRLVLQYSLKVCFDVPPGYGAILVSLLLLLLSLLLLLLLLLLYIEDITRWREDMDFMFEWQELYLTSERSERVRYSSCHENIKSISSS